MLPAQEPGCLPDIFAIGIGLDGADTGRAAAIDLRQQTRAAAVGEDGVFAAAQPKYFLQHLDTFLHGPGAWVGTEVLPIAVDTPAVIRESWPFMTTELDVGVGLVVAKQNVVARLIGLDQIVFE